MPQTQIKFAQFQFCAKAGQACVIKHEQMNGLDLPAPILPVTPLVWSLITCRVSDLQTLPVPGERISLEGPGNAQQGWYQNWAPWRTGGGGLLATGRKKSYPKRSLAGWVVGWPETWRKDLMQQMEVPLHRRKSLLRQSFLVNECCCVIQTPYIYLPPPSSLLSWVKQIPPTKKVIFLGLWYKLTIANVPSLWWEQK